VLVTELDNEPLLPNKINIWQEVVGDRSIDKGEQFIGYPA